MSQPIRTQRALSLSGGLLLLAGIIVAVSGFMAAMEAESSNRLAVVIGGIRQLDSNPGAAGYAWLSVGAFVAIAGIALLVANARRRAALVPHIA